MPAPLPEPQLPNARDGSFVDWYRANRSRVAAAMYAATGDIDVAADAADEAFVRAFERWDRVAEMANSLGWVYRVALNDARRQIRRRATERRLHAQLDVARARCLELEVPFELWSGMAALGRRERTAIALRYVADLKERDVASVMRVAPGTVARLLHDARQRLAVQMTEDRKADER